MADQLSDAVAAGGSDPLDPAGTARMLFAPVSGSPLAWATVCEGKAVAWQGRDVIFALGAFRVSRT